MTDTSQFEKTANLESLFRRSFLKHRSVMPRSCTSANEIVVKTAKAIGENQTEFMQQEAEQASKAFTPIKFDTDPGTAITAFGNQWHENSAKADHSYADDQ